MKFDIAVLPGDGVGQEVMAEGLKVLEVVGRRYGHDFAYKKGIVGGGAIDKFGTALPGDIIPMCKSCDALLFGAVGGPKWDIPTAKVRPEQAILGLRKGLGVYANLRPVNVYPMLENATPLKPEIVRGVDILVLRELTGGIYFGTPQKTWTSARGRQSVDTLRYSEKEIERIVRTGFELARSRRNKLTSVDKANVIETSRLWRQITNELAPEYPDVKLDHILVDTAAMRLIRDPSSFDVIVTENMFGDILTDEASMLTGSLGMLPSAALGDGKRGLYEPIHGSAPDIAGQGKANPCGTILSAAMLLRHSLGLEAEAQRVENAVLFAIEAGQRTGDISLPGHAPVSTRTMGDSILSRIAAG